jgi:TPR repeat protein
MVQLARCFLGGVGIEVDEKMAMQWCVRGADAGSAAAMLTLGECLRDGVGVDQDLIEGRCLVGARADGERKEEEQKINTK